MKANIYGAAAAVLRTVDSAPGNAARASDIQRALSKGQLTHFERALDLLVSHGDVEVYASSPKGPGRKGRWIRALRPAPPEPHCPTCTCHDVL